MFLNWLSDIIGRLAHLTFPAVIMRMVMKWYVKHYKLDLTHATLKFEDYKSLGTLFTRDLKPESRPIGEGLISPVDGFLRDHQKVTDGALFQIKGRSYKLDNLLGSAELANKFEGADAWNFYLSPSDAHHIFAPISGRITQTVYIPGTLWPVNDWAFNKIENLFGRNERVITIINAPGAFVAVVMIGALNVGKIKLSYHPLISNNGEKAAQIQHNETPIVDKGGKIGTFSLGSSVLLLVKGDISAILEQGPVKYGIQIAKFD